MHQQLALPIVLRDDARFDNFFPGHNQATLYHLQQQWSALGEPFIYLWGANESGVSHLLQAACHFADAQQKSSIYLPLHELHSYGPEVLEGADQFDLICLDDLEAVLTNAEWEEALFHLFNRLKNQQKRLLVAAKAPATQLPIGLADLSSRLNWGLTLHLQPLNDDEKAQALLMRAHQRGLSINEEVVRFILTHGPRSTKSLLQLLNTLDQASLIEQRKLTIPFVKAYLPSH